MWRGPGRAAWLLLEAEALLSKGQTGFCSSGVTQGLTNLTREFWSQNEIDSAGFAAVQQFSNSARSVLGVCWEESITSPLWLCNV